VLVAITANSNESAAGEDPSACGISVAEFSRLSPPPNIGVGEENKGAVVVDVVIPVGEGCIVVPGVSVEA
jgi:hypothetical protein